MNSIEKNSIRNETQHLVRMGELKKGPCQDCGEQDVEAHHPDYSDARNVEWLCRGCHQKRHSSRPRTSRTGKRYLTRLAKEAGDKLGVVFSIARYERGYRISKDDGPTSTTVHNDLSAKEVEAFFKGVLAFVEQTR